MSLLGPDDFDKTRKERAKKLAKDLPPEVQKDIDHWLEHPDDAEAFRRISERVGPDKARALLAKKRGLLKD